LRYLSWLRNWALSRLATTERRDMDKITEDLIASQSKVIATLALRISVLEKLLLEKKIITEAEIIDKTMVLSKEFITKTQEALRKAVEDKGKG